MINAPMTCLTLSRLQSVVVRRETGIQPIELIVILHTHKLLQSQELNILRLLLMFAQERQFYKKLHECKSLHLQQCQIMAIALQRKCQQKGGKGHVRQGKQ